MPRLLMALLLVSGPVLADGRFDLGEIVDSVAETIRPDQPVAARNAADAKVAQLVRGVEKCLSDGATSKDANRLNNCLQMDLAGFAVYLAKERFPNDRIRVCGSGLN